MDKIEIEGGIKLHGNVKISGAKNASLPIMAACLLSEGEIELENIPRLSDIHTMIELLEHLGAHVKIHELKDQLKINITSKIIDQLEAPYDIVRKMRASIWVLGPMLARFGRAKVSLPGGCAIGARQVDQHIESLRAMGANIIVESGYIIATTEDNLSKLISGEESFCGDKRVYKKLPGGDFTFRLQSVGATINAILAAVLVEGSCRLSNCAIEPEIVDLCEFLVKLGAKIKNIGTKELVIHGVPQLSGGKHRIIPDRIEAGTYLIAALATKGSITLNEARPDHLSNLLEKLRKAGAQIELEDSIIKAKYLAPLKAVNIETGPYPRFSTDLQAQFMSLMLIAEGQSVITENLFENRLMHAPELCRMGADIKLDKNQALVNGGNELSGANVMASDLRASVSLIIAGLCAKGTTTVNRIYHLDRGYDNLVGKLTALGAKIRRVK